ncbi:MAG: hypothetical protein JNL11_05780 [Bdellovibrionaceae bacterium]|nr:hypothetical protein [Pseudobdellovibrionaceae bacterium]
MKKVIPFLVATVFVVTSQVFAWTSTQDAADRLGATQVKEIAFDKNADRLTEAQKSEIRNAVSEAAQKGRIDEVKVFAWSDKEYPSDNKKQTKEEVGLAKNRIKHLKSFLKDDLKVKSVDEYNMAERPSAIEKLFNTSDAKIKNTAESAGAAPTEGNTGLFDLKAQASKGVVMIFLKR